MISLLEPVITARERVISAVEDQPAGARRACLPSPALVRWMPARPDIKWAMYLWHSPAAPAYPARAGLGERAVGAGSAAIHVRSQRLAKTRISQRRCGKIGARS